MNASQSNQHLPLFREAVLLLAFPLLTRLSVMMVMLFSAVPVRSEPFSFLSNLVGSYPIHEPHR